MGDITNTKYVLATSVQDDKTWLDIIYSAISETLVNIGEWYVLRDEYGSVCIRSISDMKLDLVLGDGSMVYGFDYEKSIDDNFYNYIKIANVNESNKSVEVIVKKDDESIARFGLLQYFETNKNSANTSQVKTKAEQLLKLYNKESETLSLQCLGDLRIRAGSNFYGQVEDIQLDKRLIVKSVTHDFLPYHTMSLEVAI